MNNRRDFRPFGAPRRPAFPAAGNVPIIGSQPPPEIRDHLGRVLDPGDGVILQIPTAPIFEVIAVEEVNETVPPGHPGWMDITLRCMMKFRAVRGQTNTEFVRVLTHAETQASTTIPVDPPAAKELPKDEGPEAFPTEPRTEPADA